VAVVSGFGDYDRWKTTDPSDWWPECAGCGGNMRRIWPNEWFCERCDEENEYRERQLDEQENSAGAGDDGEEHPCAAMRTASGMH
jgi:hypothetical protein